MSRPNRWQPEEWQANARWAAVGGAALAVMFLITAVTATDGPDSLLFWLTLLATAAAVACSAACGLALWVTYLVAAAVRELEHRVTTRTD